MTNISAPEQERHSPQPNRQFLSEFISDALRPNDPILSLDIRNGGKSAKDTSTRQPFQPVLYTLRTVMKEVIHVYDSSHQNYVGKLTYTPITPDRTITTIAQLISQYTPEKLPNESPEAHATRQRRNGQFLVELLKKGKEAGDLMMHDPRTALTIETMLAIVQKEVQLLFELMRVSQIRGPGAPEINALGYIEKVMGEEKSNEKFIEKIEERIKQLIEMPVPDKTTFESQFVFKVAITVMRVSLQVIKDVEEKLKKYRTKTKPKATPLPAKSV